jgi:hypothetical protein
LHAAQAQCGPEDVVLCAGSLVLVGEVRTALGFTDAGMKGDSLAHRIIAT